MFKKIGYSTADGIIHGISLCMLMDFVFSKAAQGKVAVMFPLCFLCLGLVSAVSFVLFKREKAVALILCELGSVCVSIIVILLMTLLRQFGFSFFAIRNLTNADGLMLAAMFCLFAFLSIIGRIIVFLIILSINIVKRAY